MDVHYMELQINARLVFSMSLVKTSKNVPLVTKLFESQKTAHLSFEKTILILLDMPIVEICFEIISFQKALLVWKCYIFPLTPYVYFASYARHPICTFNKHLVHLIDTRRLHF